MKNVFCDLFLRQMSFLRVEVMLKSISFTGERGGGWGEGFTYKMAWPKKRWKDNEIQEENKLMHHVKYRY